MSMFSEFSVLLCSWFFFFKDVLSSCFSWHCENVTHFRCNAASLIAVKSSLTADRMWNYRRKKLTYMQGNFSLVSICEMFEFAMGRAIRIPLGSCIQTNTLRTIFISQPFGVRETSCSQGICASWSVRNHSLDKWGFPRFISVSDVSQTRLISVTLTKNLFITETLLANENGDSSCYLRSLPFMFT